MYNPALDNVLVEFALTPKTISAKDHERMLFEATIGLNDNGDRRLNISGKEYDLWQLRRKALEHLMFGVKL